MYYWWEAPLWGSIGRAPSLVDIWPFFFFQTDHKTAQRNLLPLGRIIWDHAVHPGCWLCLLSRAFSSFQTVSEVNPGTAVERARCCHCVCQVSFCFIPTFWVLHKTTRLSTHGHACDFPSRVAVAKPVRNICLIFCCQAGFIGSGHHGHFSWLHHCFFLWGHHRGPVSPVMLQLDWALLILPVTRQTYKYRLL